MKAILFISALFLTLHTSSPQNCQDRKCNSFTLCPAKPVASKVNLSGEGCIPGWMLNIFRNLSPQT